MSKHIRNDFDNEIKRGNIPFKAIITSISYAKELYIQFKELEPLPKLSLYIVDKVDLKALDAEKTANLIGSSNCTKYQDTFNKAIKEFNELDKVDPQYYGRKIEETPIIQTLIKVEDKIKRLEGHSRDKKNSTSSFLPIAKEASSEVINLLNGLPFRNEVLEDIVNRKDGTGYLIDYLYNTKDRSHSKKGGKRYREDSKDRYIELRGMFNNQIKQAPKETVKSKGNEPGLSLKPETFEDLFKNPYRDHIDKFVGILKSQTEYNDGKEVSIVSVENRWNGNKQIARVFYEELLSFDIVINASTRDYGRLFSKYFKGLDKSFSSTIPGPHAGDKRTDIYHEIKNLKAKLA